MVFEIGRVCVKLAGRDAGKYCVVVNTTDVASRVLVDGQTRRRECNISHIEPTSTVVDISADADHATVVAALESLGLSVAKKGDAKSPGAKPVRQKVNHKKQ